MCVGVLRIQLERAPEMLLRSGGIPLIEKGFERQRCVRLGRGVVQLECLQGGRPRARGIASRGDSTAASNENPSDSYVSARPA